MTALRTKIKTINEGKYVQQEGFEPNYILTQKGTRLSRVRILGTVVGKFASENKKFASLTLDDGSDTIRVKVFNAVSMFDNIAVGDIVDTVGKIREYNEEIYLIPEVISKVDNPNIEILRELEIEKQEEELEEQRRTILENQKQTTDLDELKKMMKKFQN